MKKLLLLGGSRYILPVIEEAHDLGYHVITCDYLPDNIAHKYSDEYLNVSILDREAVLALAREQGVSGVMSFATDPGVVTAAYVCEQLGLPTCPYASVEILQNKDKFRAFLRDNGFTVPMAGGYESAEAALADAGKYRWPVIVKPVDSAGSKGVSVAREPGELKGCIDYALANAHNGRFILEEFIEKQGDSSDTDCFSVDGKLVFTSFSNQQFDERADNPYTPAAYSWPSKMPQAIQDELRSELQRLVTLLDLGTSIYNIETRMGTDGKAYIMEVSPRGGGNRLAEMLHYATGVNLIRNAVKAAMGEGDLDVEQRPYDGFWGEVILHSEENGRFQALSVAPELAPFVYETQLWVGEGDEVRTFTGANEAIGTLVLKCESDEALTDFLRRIRDLVKVEIRKEK